MSDRTNQKPKKPTHVLKFEPSVPKDAKSYPVEIARGWAYEKGVIGFTEHCVLPTVPGRFVIFQLTDNHNDEWEGC